MVGVMPIPWETIYAVGDNFTADDIFEVSTDGSVKKQGFAKIERIIVLKHDKDATEKKRRKQLEDLINYFAEVDSFHGRPIKYAESVIPPAVTMEAEAYEDFFGAEYEQHLIKTAHSLYPTHQMYEANV